MGVSADPARERQEGPGAPHHLLGDHHAGLDGKFAAAHVEHVLERRAEEVHHEDVVQARLAKVVDLRDAGWGPRPVGRCELGGL